MPETRQPLSPPDAVPPHVAAAAAPGTSGLTGVVVGVVIVEQRGLGARVVPNAAVARETIASLDVDGVAMACVVFVEIRGHPAHLRLLLRRLRARLPAAPLLVGLWPADEPMLADRELQREVGATHCVSTLGGAVTICVDSAHAGAPAVETAMT